MDRQLSGVAEAAHRLPRRGDTYPQVEQSGDQRHHPHQGPTLILAVAGRCRPAFQPFPQPSQLLVRQFWIRARGALRAQSLRAAGNPGPPPLIRRLRRHFQPLSDLDRRHTSREQFRRLLPYLLAPDPFHLVNATTIAVPHETSRPDTTHTRRSPESLTVDSKETSTPKGV